MFAKLTGKIDKVIDNQIIFDVNNVGYLVHCSSATLNKVSNISGNVSLLIETFVREDAINLFGFAEEVEKYWFNQLMKVSGVGPKVGISILSSLTPEELQTAIFSKDKNMFKKVSGVGPKLAERIITELKNVNGKVAENIVSISQNIGTNKIVNNVNEDAIMALEKLGFSRADAYMCVNKILSENNEASLQDIIKQGLKQLSRIA
jgi:Holliday junction DNA helicase RuvA